MGPAQPSPGARGQPGLYRIEAFEVKLRQRQALCPQGKVSTECSKLTEKETGKVTYRFEFGRQCQTCPVKHLCIPKGQPHRMIRVGALHEVLHQRRREQQTEAFKLRMHQRNGIEGTISELVRGHGMRRARYRGFAKVDLQNQLIAAACNVKRWLEKLARAASQPLQPYPEGHLGPCNLLNPLGLLISSAFSYLSDPPTPFGRPNPVFLGL